MKNVKKRLISNYTITFLFCQLSVLFPLYSTALAAPSDLETDSASLTETLNDPEANSVNPTKTPSNLEKYSDASPLSPEKSQQISGRCEEIKNRLKSLQKDDSRVRVGLGHYYENILNKFIVPLNVRLIENALPEVKLVNNQNSFADARMNFNTDFIEYQKSLEELIQTDCKTYPNEFYEKLLKVRQSRAYVEEDVIILNRLARLQITLTSSIKESL
ncbi:MAG: hypothetical protein Q4A79_01645 [Candidatus Saccharibacteria bacterium]|nr:hypothetical protein [Candidatus Saccharibacteria bacterium]